MVHDRIIVDPKIMFGKPVIKGTRITVELILRKLGTGMTDDQLLEHHQHLRVEDIHAAAAFAADHLGNEDLRDCKTPARNRKYSLRELVKGITKKNRHKEI